MALPQDLLSRLPGGVSVGAIAGGGTAESWSQQAAERTETPTGLGLDWPALNAVLPDAGLLRGAVTELSCSGGAAWATSLSLLACRAGQRESSGQLQFARETQKNWCAFIDPSATLHAPGVVQLGVDPQHLLVVRPPLEALGREALGRVALRLVESKVFRVVIIDALGSPNRGSPNRGSPSSGSPDRGSPNRGSPSSGSPSSGSPSSGSLGSADYEGAYSVGKTLSSSFWTRIVRRLSLAVEGTETCVLLLTDREAPRSMPLPVAMRIELTRSQPGMITVAVAKDRWGRVSTPQRIQLFGHEAAESHKEQKHEIQGKMPLHTTDGNRISVDSAAVETGGVVVPLMKSH